ncbi:MAG: TraB/GumN family protein [Myxococcales bacterium]|nr:TraB/GumN family protein [Myxococcales bacterium]
MNSYLYTAGSLHAIVAAATMSAHEFPQTVRRLSYRDKTIYIVGTAHVSKRSVEEVKHVIDTVMPDTVCVELDDLRYQTLIDTHRWRRLDLFQIIREKKVLFLIANLVLSAYQRRLGDLLGVRPGAELIAAIEKAHEHGLELVLADRDIQATLKRTWANLSLWKKSQLISVMTGAFFSAKDVSEEEIEKLKDRDVLNDAMAEFARTMPEVKVPLIDERDQYMMSTIQEAPGQTIVAVVGAGHVEGMVNHLGESVDRKALQVIPPPSIWATVLAWLIPALVLASFIWGYQKHAGQTLGAMLLAWCLPTSVGAALMTIGAGARAWTVVAAFFSSPLTTLNPAIGVGMVTGPIEAALRRPTIEDCENIQYVSTLKDWYQNRVTRVLLVVIFSSIGAAAGAFVGASWLVSLL